MNYLLLSPPGGQGRLFVVATVLRWAVAGFFIFLAYKNFSGDPKMIREFESWGYPNWFRMLTAVCQLASAILLFIRPAVFWGGALIACMMAVAAYTHLRYDPPLTAISPALFLCIAVFISCMYRPEILRQTQEGPTEARYDEVAG